MFSYARVDEFTPIAAEDVNGQISSMLKYPFKISLIAYSSRNRMKFSRDDTIHALHVNEWRDSLNVTRGKRPTERETMEGTDGGPNAKFIPPEANERSPSQTCAYLKSIYKFYPNLSRCSSTRFVSQGQGCTSPQNVPSGACLSRVSFLRVRPNFGKTQPTSCAFHATLRLRSRTTPGYQ